MMTITDWVIITIVMAIGVGIGYWQGKGSASGRTRVKTIAISSANSASTSSVLPSAPASELSSNTSAPPSTADAKDVSPDSTKPVDEYDADLQTTLDHMKSEHAAHLTQYQPDGGASALSPDPSSPPIPNDAHRRIFIVAYRLPLNITNITNQPAPQNPTPSGSPLSSPATGPAPINTQSNDELDESFSLDTPTVVFPPVSSSAPAIPLSASSSSLPTLNTFDRPMAKRPSLSHFATTIGNSRLPGSSVREVDGSKFQVDWDDSRSFLSNLRCLLNPTNSLPNSPTIDQPEVTWVGLSNITSTKGFASTMEQKAYEKALADNHCVPVYIDEPQLSGYQSFCRGILWPLLHYMMPTNTNQHVGLRWAEFWEAYCAANQIYADTICAQMRESHSGGAVEEPIIWCHNMHLFGLPQMIRQQLPRASIGLFIHTPFPSSDVFRSLPSRREILESMMEANILGFHTFDNARHFLSCIKRVLDLDFETLPGGVMGIRYNGRFVSIIISHVGIQSNVFAEAANSDVLKRRVDRLRSQYAGKKLIVGIEDVDLAKAPMLKLQAFDRFLTRYPEWKNKIVILEFFLPSKNMDSILGDKIQRDLDAFILELKRKHGEEIIQVIKQKPDANGHNGGIKLMELVRLYNAADVALISTFFDGLNLIPFEATASQGSSIPCAMIISEFMGCSRSLSGVIRVNPWSLEEISDALNKALSMSNDERRANHSRRYNYVMYHTVERWATNFLDQLNHATKLGSQLNYVQVGSTSHKQKRSILGLKTDFLHLPTQLLINTYSSASLRVIMLDYDGTLVPADKATVSSADDSGPPVGVVKLLKLLSDHPNNVVFLMSGRTRAQLSKWFGHLPNLGLAAEKGCHLRWPKRIAALCRFDAKREKDQLSVAESHEEEDENEDDDTESESESDLDIDGSSSDDFVDDNDWESIIPLDDLSWKSTALEIIRAYTEQTDGSYIELKEFAITWHYERADVEYGRMQAADLQKYLVKILANPAIDVLRYDRSRILEVKPHGVSKGLAATAILESLWIMQENNQRAAASQAASPTRSSRILARATSDPGLTLPNSRFGLQVLPSRGTLGMGPPEATPLSPRSSVTDFHPFVLSIGDDRADEEMFIAVQSKTYLDGRVRGRVSLPASDAFCRNVSVNSNVPTSIPSNVTSNAVHDTEISPTPVSPLIAHTGGIRPLKPVPPPSSDPNLFTVCVGMRPSNAHYYLQDLQEVLRSLYGLVLADQNADGAGTLSPTSASTTPATSPRSGLSRRKTTGNINTDNFNPTAGSDNGSSTTSTSTIGMGSKKGSFGALTNLLFGSTTKKE